MFDLTSNQSYMKAAWQMGSEMLMPSWMMYCLLQWLGLTANAIGAYIGYDPLSYMSSNI